MMFSYEGIDPTSELYRRAQNLEWLCAISNTLINEGRISQYEAARHEKQPYFVDFVVLAWQERCKMLDLAISAACAARLQQSQLYTSKLKESLLDGLKNGELENWDVFGMLEAISLIDNPPKEALKKGTPNGFGLLPEWCSEILKK